MGVRRMIVAAARKIARWAEDHTVAVRGRDPTIPTKISELLAARAGPDQLVDEEIVHACIMVFVAGNETTKSLCQRPCLAH
jgi:cytochrome P450